MEHKSREGARAAIFFDRDGTLNEDVHYLHRKEDFVWIAGAIDALRAANRAGYLAIVVTNQSGVARGYYDEAAVNDLHAWMREELAAHGARIDAFYYCPYHVDGTIPAYAKESADRKPNTGMIDRACRDFSIDRGRSYLVGDAESDMECARRAGLTGIRYTEGNLLEILQSVISPLGKM